MNQTHPTHEQLIDYLHGELSAHDDARVHAHIAACASCARAHEDEAALTDLLRTHAVSEERDLPPGLATRILATAQSDRSPSWRRRLSFVLRPAIALPAAAVLALAAYFGSVAWHGGAPVTTIDAAYYVEDHAALATTMPFGEEPAMPALLTSDDASTDEQAVDETH